ncbi:sulfotransferase family protein [Glycomyces buryatensis]|uniref:sulfotransferase family protein n=1 Tax=Glycomyces buryatensis TaxID=2570927 RepID=UPI0014562F41|nr:sulfotransferase [Glycomyces buryatensis]
MITAEGPLFLVGAQRSGTTALGLAIAQRYADSGRVFTVNGRLPSLLRRWWTDDDIADRHLRSDDVNHALLRHSATGPSAQAWLARCAEVLPEVAQEVAYGRHDGRDSVDLIREAIERVYGGYTWGDKYNEYLLELPWLSTVFPHAKWIFVHRHPAAVVRSMMEWRKDKPWNPRTAAACEAKWIAWNERWLSFRSGIPKGHALTVSYEQLCGGATAELSDFVGLSMGEALREYRRQGSDAEASDCSEAALHVWERLGRP